MCVCVCDLCMVSSFFFKQKTAYEMRISDWSSDVCSSDLIVKRILSSLLTLLLVSAVIFTVSGLLPGDAAQEVLGQGDELIAQPVGLLHREIGRASCRERVCQYV